MPRKKQVKKTANKNVNVNNIIKPISSQNTKKYNWYFILAIILAVLSIIMSFFIIIPVIGLILSLILFSIYLVWFIISIIMLRIFIKNDMHWAYFVLPIYYVITFVISFLIGSAYGLSGRALELSTPMIIYLTIIFSILEIIYASYILLRKN